MGSSYTVPRRASPAATDIAIAAAAAAAVESQK
jgi:hypothetical protein